MRKFSTALLVFLSFTSLRAVDNDMALGLSFPLRQEGGKVVMAYSVLIRPDSILRQGAWLRTIFIPPQRDDADVKKAKRGIISQDAYARPREEPRSSEIIDPIDKAAYERAIETIWKDEVSFRSALEHFGIENAHVVFQQPDSQDVSIKQFDLPKGMLLAQVDNQIKALHVVPYSLADQGGIKAGMVLVELNQEPLNGSLESFQKAYATAQNKETKEQMNLVALDQGQRKDIILKLPKSLNFDFWAESDKNASKK